MKNLTFIISAFILLTASCSKDSSESLSSDTGTGGSMACFTIMGNYLYTVDVNTLRIFDIQIPAQPVLVGTKYVGINIETIFNNGNNLFIGSSNGIYILSVTNPVSPVIAANYQHVQSCDPVIADTVNAWVTLNTNNEFCGNSVNELQVLNISNIYSPYLVKRYTLTGPMGLAKNDSSLFVCDNGLKIFDCRNVSNLLLMQHQSITAWDLILNDTILIVTGPAGLTQYRLNGYGVDFLSSISVNQ